jgi:hypothetical protein
MYPSEAEKRLESIVMLGSPVYGAPLAILGLAGQALPGLILGRLHPDNDVATLVRTWPSMYQLLPPPRDLFPGAVEYPADWDLYDAEVWKAPGLRQDYLDDAQQLHRRLADADPQVEIFEIGGCHRRTLNCVQCISPERLGEDADYCLEYDDSGDGAGDGIVPLWSVRSDDLHTYYSQTTHEALAYDSGVIEAIVDLVHGEEPSLAREVPEREGIIDRLGSEPLVQRVAALRERLEEGTFSREDLRSFLFRR